MKGFRVTKIRKENIFEGVLTELELDERVLETISYNESDPSSSFHVKRHPTEKV